MSACLSAGASFTPSPVMATNSPCTCRACTMRIFCAGSTRAYTRTWRTLAMRVSSSSVDRSAPVSTAASAAATMPKRSAMARAVAGWSPVIITGVMPAAMHSRTASSASERGGSIKPMSPSRERSRSVVWALAVPSGSVSCVRWAMASTRRPWAAKASARASQAGASKRVAEPAVLEPAVLDPWRVHSGITDSGAPLV